MKKKAFCLFLVFATLSLAGCGKATLDQSEIYNKINDLTGDLTSDYIYYKVDLTAEDKNISLENWGCLTKEDGEYTYTYSTQTLNKIGSGADALVSTNKGEYKGNKEEILAQGFGVTDGAKLFALNLKDSFKSYKITEESDSYVMTGYIARNTIIKYTEGIDDDIRFNYKITVNKDATEIEKLEIYYVTTYFDSVDITMTFKEASK